LVNWLIDWACWPWGLLRCSLQTCLFVSACWRLAVYLLPPSHKAMADKCQLGVL